MSSETVIEVSGVGKCFRMFDKPIHRLANQLFDSRLSRRDFWALREIDFQVHKGETIGLVGRNGSGKSTLLEIIVGTMQQTEGEVRVTGPVAALLELGAGFNPEFTGRENALMNAAIIGIPAAQAQSYLENIADFAEVGDYLDQPVKTYSSGMYVRLAFATAISFDPDILIVDEALSVGDIRFQRKCFRKFEELKQSDKTILFVTHSAELVKVHCDRAIFLDAGRIRDIGSARDVVHSYLDFMFSGTIQDVPVAPGAQGVLQDSAVLNQEPAVDGCALRPSYNNAEYRWGDQRAKIIDYQLECEGRIDPPTYPRGALLEVRLSIHFREPLSGLIYGITIRTVDGITVYGANTRDKHVPVAEHLAGEVTTVSFAFRLGLVPGDYFISLGVAAQHEEHDHIAIDRRYDMILLPVTGDIDDFGIADLRVEISEAWESA